MESICIFCGTFVGESKFLCPCDLFHSICGLCSLVIERKDCAHSFTVGGLNEYQ